MFILNFFKKLNSFIPSFIRRNFLRKVIAIFFAILVYMKVSTELGEEKIIQGVPINFVTHGNIEVMGFKPRDVNITIRASKKSVNLLTHSGFRIDIPITDEILKKYKSTDYDHINIDINQSYVHTPSGVDIVSINPSDLTVRCDKNVSKKVPVEPLFKGAPPLDYMKGVITVTPKHVTLTGPESILKEVKTINTDPIILDMSTVDSFQVDKKLQPVAPKVISSPSSVQVKVEVYKALATRVFENIPLFVLSSNKYEMFTSKLLTHTVDVTLHGPKSHLELLTKNQIRAFVDIASYSKPGIYEAKVDTWCKDSKLDVKFIEPSFVKVELTPTTNNKPAAQEK
jgi:YbbR domain-containing protein